MSEIKTMPFSQHLAHLSKGSVDEELSETLKEVVQAVRDTRKKGSITLTIEVKMLNENGDHISFKPKVTSKKPQFEMPADILYSTYGGDVLRDDPEQKKLDLQLIGERSKTVAEVPEVKAKISE